MTTKNPLSCLPGLLLAAAVLGAVEATAEPLDTAPFSHIRNVETVAEQEEIAALNIDADTWDLLRAGAPDLRVVDTAGTPAPHLLRRATEKRIRRVSRNCAFDVTALRELEGNRIEVELKLRSDEPGADTLVLVTPLKDFERRVSVDGLPGNGESVRLVTDALVYDYSRYMDVRSVKIDLPRNNYKKLLVTIEAVTDTTLSPRTEITRTIAGGSEAQRTETTQETTRPFRIDTVQLQTHRDEAANRETVRTDIPLENFEITRDDNLHATVIHVETGNQPLNGITIRTASRNFTRRASVQIPYRRDGREQWRTIAQKTLSRISFRDFRREELEIPFDELQQRRLRIVLHDGDSPPLEELSPIGRGPIWQALFLASPAAKYEMLVGSEHAQPPAYDTAHIARLLERDITPKEFALSPLTANPAFNAKAGRSPWAWLGGKMLFGIVLVLVVAVLGLGLVRAGKSALIEEE